MRQLFRTDHQNNIGCTRLKVVCCFEQGGRRAGAGIFDVGNRYPSETEWPQCCLPSDHVLTFKRTLAGVRKPRGLDLWDRAISVSKRLAYRLTREVLNRTR